MVRRRLGSASLSEPVLEYVKTHFPLDPKMGSRITSNPLMLSMVVSIAEMRHTERNDKLMPETAAGIYEVAVTTMLERVDRKERGAEAVGAGEQLSRLLQVSALW